MSGEISRGSCGTRKKNTPPSVEPPFSSLAWQDGARTYQLIAPPYSLAWQDGEVILGGTAHTAQRGAPHLMALTGRRVEFDDLYLVSDAV